MIRRHVLAAACAFAVTSAAGLPALAQDSVEDFYSGRTMEFIIGYSPGGTYDRYARLVSRFLPQHIPGNPEIIARNMPGASSRLAASYVYNVAPQDGTVLFTADQSLPLAQAMGDESLDFVPGEFQYIGNNVVDNNVLLTWAECGIKTIEDAREQEVTVGATGGSTSSQYPSIMNEVLGTQFRIITGYPGGSEILLAMENGEVCGRGSWNFVGVKSSRPGWLEEGIINILVQIGLERDPDLPEVPLLMELADTEADQRMLRLLSSPTAVGRPVIVGPGVPEERVAALRDAFAAMVEDPEFLAAAEDENLDIRPLTGTEVQAVVDDIIATPPEVAERLGELIGVN